MKKKNIKIDGSKYPEEMKGLIEHINKVNSGDKEEIDKLKKVLEKNK